ncbi:MAG: hypothetical protein ACKOIA_02730, partial [Acidimicrobiia bacterium]
MERRFPAQLEIVPFDGPAIGRVRSPGSKSITNRAVLVAALAEGRSVLTGALEAEDTAAMLDCVVGLGATVTREGATVVIDGLGGVVSDGRPVLYAAQPVDHHRGALSGHRRSESADTGERGRGVRGLQRAGADR